MNPSLAGIQKKIEELADKINAPRHLLPAYGSCEEYQPNISLDAKGQLHYEIYERGQLITDEAAATEDDLFYSVFRDVSFSMAVAYELKNRNPRHDTRRDLFAKQLALLGQLNENWKEKRQKEHQQILQANPFDDNVNLRIDYLDQLRKTGTSYEQAMSLANKKFPPLKNN